MRSRGLPTTASAYGAGDKQHHCHSRLLQLSWLLFLLVSMPTLQSCGDNDDFEESYLVADVSSVSVDTDGQTFTIGVRANVTISVDISDSWITQSGKTTSTATYTAYTFTAEANPTTQQRTATITLSGGQITSTVTVSQDGAYLNVSPTEVSVDADGGLVSLSVNTNITYSVAISDSWLTQTSSSSLSPTFTAESNPTTEQRTATITLSWGDIVGIVMVTQEASNLPKGGIDNFTIDNW